MKLEHLFLAIMVVNHEINDLYNTIKGLSVEENILVVQERMLGGLDINLGSLDTMVKRGFYLHWAYSLLLHIIVPYFKKGHRFTGKSSAWNHVVGVLRGHHVL